LGHILEQILETLISKATTNEKVFAQAISDIDSYGKDGNTSIIFLIQILIFLVGLFGGLVGEILTLLSTIESLKDEEEYAQFKNIEITQEVIDDLIQRLFGELFEGVVELGVGPEVEAAIAELGEETLNLETLHTIPERIPELEQIIRPAIKSYILNFIRKNLETLGLKAEFLEWILDSIVKLVFTQDEACNNINNNFLTIISEKSQARFGHSQLQEEGTQACRHCLNATFCRRSCSIHIP